MAITKPNRPEFIASGDVVNIAPRYEWDRDTNRRTNVVIGYDVTLQQDEGAQFSVRMNKDRDTGRTAVPVPELFSHLSVLTELNESQQYGVTLQVLRELTDDDLDRLRSHMHASMTAAAKS